MPSFPARQALRPTSRASALARWAFLLAAAVSVAPSTSRADVQHVIGKGHTLTTIANRYHVTVDAILAANHLTKSDAKRLQLGDSLIIPGVKDTSKEKEKARLEKEKEKEKARLAKEKEKEKEKVEKEKAKEAKEKARKAIPVDESDPAAVRAAERLKKKEEREKARAEKEAKIKAEKEAKAKAKAKEKEAKAKEKAKAKGFATAPKTPGVVHLHRLAFAEDYELQTGTKPGQLKGEAKKKFAWMMRFTNNQTHSIDPRLAARLGVVSDHFGSRPIQVISGYRPYSKKQYTKDSRHNHGRAIDFHVAGVPNTVVRDFCRTIPKTGCGYYPNSTFVHMDARDESAYWVDYARPGEPPKYEAGHAKHADEGTSDVHLHAATSGASESSAPSAPADPPAVEPSAPAQ